MATLKSQAEALIEYANGVTGKTDASLGDCVKSLADYYGGSSESVFPTITDADLLSSQVQALITYANSVDGKSDVTLGDAMRSLAIPAWMKEASEMYGIPLNQCISAYKTYGNVFKNGVQGISYLSLTLGQGGDMGVKCTNNTTYTVKYYQLLSRLTHYFGVNKVKDEISTGFLLMQNQAANTIRTDSATSSATADFSNWRNLQCAKDVIYATKYNYTNYYFSGRIYFIHALKDDVCTHFWMPNTNGKLLDIITGEETSWSATYVTS